MSPGSHVPVDAPVPILLMSHSLGHGGGERQLALTALALDRARYQPHVACSEGGHWVSRLQEAGISFFFIQSRSLMSAAAVSEARRLRRYIRDHGIKVVQTFDYSMNLFGIGAAYKAPGVRALSNLRCNTSLIPPKYRMLNRMALRSSRAVVVNSTELSRHVATVYGIDPGRIFICRNGLDTSIFHPASRRLPGLEDASAVIGTMSVLRPEKNIPLLLEAFATLAQTRPGLRLLIVGSGPEETMLRARAEGLGITGKCVFHPATTDVTACLWSMDIFVLASLSEGLSNVIMEAMACGCCVVASNVGGNPELVTHGVNGLLFTSNDRSSLTEQLAAVVDSVDRRKTLASAAAARMEAEFSLQKAALCMQGIYDAVLS